MAETLTIRTASSTEVIKIAVQGPQGPAGAPGTGLETLTTQGDTLYRGASAGERLPIGTAGQVLKVVNGLPAWANESGAVSSVAGRTGAVTLASADISSEQVLEVSEAGDANCNGVFVYGGDYNGRPTYYKDKNTFVYWDNLWNISHNADDKYVGTNTSRPWQAVWSLGSATGNLPVVDQLNGQEYEKAVGQRTNPTAFGTASGKNVGTGANDVAAGNDARFSDSRTPTAHAASHASAGSDPLFDQDLNTTDSVTFNDGTFQSFQCDELGVLGEAGIGWGSEDGRLNTRTNLGLGDAATADIGTAAGEVAAGDHGHGNLSSDGKLGTTAGLPVVTTTAGAVTTLALGTANQVLRVNSGATGVEFADPSGGGVTGAAASASDVLGVSGANITGVDAGSADRLVFWDDSANKLTYLEAGSGLSISGATLTATATGTIGGSTSTDNAIVRGDSTSNTVQDSALVIDDATTSTQANVAVVNAHSETNSALVLTPKGTGAFIVGPKPDGTSTGGNARGANAVDIQTGDRSGATQVASGSQSVAVGTRCIASGSSAVAIGRASTASGNDSIALRGSASNSQSIAIGASSSATSIVSIAIGNQANCTGQNAVAIGYDPDATAQSAVAIGVVASATAIAATSIIAPASLRAQFATLPFSAVYWSGQTTNNTATILNLDGAATSRFTIAASTALAVDILLVARRATTQDKWLVARRFLGIRRDGSNNTALIGAVQTLGTDQSAGSPTWTFALTADDTNEALQLEVTGATGETVEWRATAFYRVV